MAAHRKYDLAVVTGTYTDRNTGTTKNRYQNIGVEMESDDGGRFILLDPLVNLAAVPRGNGKDRIMVSKFEVQDNAQNQAAPQYAQQPAPQQPVQHAAPQGYYNADGTPMTPQQVAQYQQQMNQQGQR